MIPLQECKQGSIYELRSRNLVVGVFVEARRGFIGIRQKFDSRYLFTEYHYDTGPPFGTARPIKLLGEIDNPRIQLWERYPGSTCYWCGRAVVFEETAPPRGIWKHAIWKHIEDTTPDFECDEVSPMSNGTYTPLFWELQEYEDEIEQNHLQTAQEGMA